MTIRTKRGIHHFNNEDFSKKDLRDLIRNHPLQPNKDLSLRIVIPSRSRWEYLNTSLRVFPTAYVSVSDSEADKYIAVGVPEERLMVHPDSVNTLAKKRNWVFDNTPEECCVQADDDCKYCVCMVGVKARSFQYPDAILRIIENGYIMAKDIGCPAFCWSRTISNKQGGYTDAKPFGLSPMLSNVWGQIGRKYRADENILTRPDMDLSLQMLRDSRFFLMDNRFYFDCYRIGTGKGGNQVIRTKEKDQADIDYLKSKWGDYIQFTEKSNSLGNCGIKINVQRQALISG